MVDDVVKRVYDRMERAKYLYADHVEITREEYDHLRDLERHKDELTPEHWPQWAKDYRFVPPAGMDGVIFGFPAKVVPTLSPDVPPTEIEEKN